METATLEAGARTLVDADLAVALTGAGISTESGIPDFRSDGGVWDEYDDRAFTIDRFQDDPDGFWRDWLDLRAALIPEDAAPNPAHDALSTLEAAGHLQGVITQNVDGLHRAAGSDRVIRIHGTGDRARCPGCGARVPAETATRRARETATPPRCEDCGDVLKPDVVLFGERLPRNALSESRRLARSCDVMLVVGSSLSVEPAGSLPRRAGRSGATLIVVNREPTPVRNQAQHTFRGDAGTILPALATAAVDLE